MTFFLSARPGAAPEPSPAAGRNTLPGETQLTQRGEGPSLDGRHAYPLIRGAGLPKKREAGCGPTSEATSRSAEIRYDRDQLFGVHGLGNVRLEARGQQANTVIAASVGGQCDGRQSG